ncbi:hypothetical protein [Methylobacterium nigriterrae]|uniref:hypothetical protein n=1 Tax=Methylobacterium nigriterrae TaxID=3127512 RepID=UPI003013816C
MGWHLSTFRHRRQDGLTRGPWGYITIPTVKGEHMMSLVSHEALSHLVKGSSARQVRAFRRWLERLDEEHHIKDA